MQTTVFPQGLQSFLEAQADKQTSVISDRIMYFIDSNYKQTFCLVNKGGSKGLEPSPTQSQ